MLHKLLIAACLFCASNLFAQNTNTAPLKVTLGSGKPAEPQVDYKQMGAPLPQLRLAQIIDTSENKSIEAAESKAHSRKMRKYEEEHHKEFLTNDDLDNGANLFVMMFNPTCGHCQDETEMVENNIALFKKSQWILVANPHAARYVPDFIKQLHVYDYAPFYIGIDSSSFLDKVFLYAALPQINIYNKNRKLIKTYNGEVGIDSLKQYIE